MRIGFIGAGKVATAFGRYVNTRGGRVSGYYDRHPEKVAHACHGTQATPFNSAAEVMAASDMVLITTRDDQIAGVCQALCDQKAIGAAHLVGHMSGAHASLILEPAARRGAAIFSLHPLQAFAREDKALTDLPHTWFSLEGSDPRLAAVETLMKKTGNPFFRLKPEHKPLYHLSACIFSNYLVTLMAAGLEALTMSGIAPMEGFQAMLPLIQGTIANIANLGPAKALTGPIARGDRSTVQYHLEALAAGNADSLKRLYTFMGLKTLDLAVQDVLRDEKKADALRDFLKTQ